MKTRSLSQVTMCVLLLGLCLIGCSLKPASLRTASTPEQAKALLSEAVSFYKANGRDKAFAEINNRRGKFVQGDLYIFVYASNGVIAAHGGDVTQVGTDISKRRDDKGKLFGREIMRVGEAGGSVDYVWQNPATGKVQPKTSFIIPFDGYRFGCGVYK